MLGSWAQEQRAYFKDVITWFWIRDIANILIISPGCVLRAFVSYADVELKPGYGFYHQVQVDELYNFVQSKKKKVWILRPNKGNIYTNYGKRSRKTLKDLFKGLKDIYVNLWGTDAWKAF